MKIFVNLFFLGCFLKTFIIFCAHIEARAEINGPSEKYLKPGSILRLSCRVLENIENPLYIFWYHNSRMINYDLHRGINVSTEPGMLLPIILHALKKDPIF